MKYLKVWTSFREVISALGDAEKGRLFVSMLEYAESGKEPVAGGNERFIWPIAKMNIDMMAKANDKLRENGERGGRPTETKPNQTEPNQTKENQDEPNETKTAHIKDKVKDKDKEKDNDNENDMCVVRGGKPRFTPPTADEVRAYCDERHNAVDAERFVDFYSAKGWKIGKEPMKDWKAAVRTWERSSTNTATQAAQPKKSANPFLDMLKGRETVEVVPDEGGYPY